MKKLISLVLAFAFVMALASVSFATTNRPAAKNIQYLNEYGEYNDPYVQVIRVRYGRTGANEASLASGTVVSWDVNSADGITVSAIVGTTAGLAAPIAGVLVTALQTQDATGAIGANDNYGYMAVRGFCLASIDTSEATAGQELIPSNALIGAFGTRDLVQSRTSQDSAGVLLIKPASDTTAPVTLK